MHVAMVTFTLVCVWMVVVPQTWSDSLNESGFSLSLAVTVNNQRRYGGHFILIENLSCLFFWENVTDVFFHEMTQVILCFQRVKLFVSVKIGKLIFFSEKFPFPPPPLSTGPAIDPLPPEVKHKRPIALWL